MMNSVLILLRDFRYAARALRKSLPVTLAIIGCLGFGIGSVTVIYSLAEGLLLRPLPSVPRMEELVTIRAQARNASVFASHPEYLDWRGEAKSVSGLAACSLYLFSVRWEEGAGDRGEPAYGLFVSANYFDVLGIHAAAGRTFVPKDDEPENEGLVAVISDRLWQSRLGRAPDVVGRMIRINGHPATIVGVSAPGFGGTLAGASFDVWVPIVSYPTLVPTDPDPMDSRANRWLDTIGRIRPGATRAQVNEEFQSIGRAMETRFAESRGRSIRVAPLDTGVAQQLRPLFASLIALTAIVLLTVCSNVANLLLVRGASRAREFGVRVALGATRARLTWQLMAENLLLAGAGALVGVWLAAWGRQLFFHLLPTTTIPLDVQAPMNGRVLLFILVLTSATVVLFGLLPAVTASRVQITQALSGGARGSSARRSWMRDLLVVAQFALALTTLVSASVFLQRAKAIEHMDRGFKNPDRILLIQSEASLAGYRDLGAWQASLERIVEQVEKAPGVESATWATFVPLGYVGYVRREVAVEGYTPGQGESMRFLINGVGPGYFDLMGIPLRQGRPITGEDRPGQQQVAVVNESFVRRFWPKEPPLGRRVTLGGRTLTVVGVARDGLYDYKVIDDPPGPLVYYALAQAPSRFTILHTKTRQPANTAVSAVRKAVASVDPHFATLPPISLEGYTELPLSPAKMGVLFLGVLSGAALFLSGMGLQAIIAYGVAVRTREIGIRVALGASRTQVVNVFLRQALLLTASGTVVGLLCTVAAVALLRNQLAYLAPPAVSSVLWATATLAAVGLAAGFIPARRSAQIDPVITLRAE